MDFQRARTSEQIELRQLNIMEACSTLFAAGGYDNVNIKAISEMTTITRSSIYTYYKTKDEIILDLLKVELLDWQEELIKWISEKKALNIDDFCNRFTEILLQHEQMLMYFSLLYTSLEKNCRINKLVEFKKKIVPVMGTLVALLNKYCKQCIDKDMIDTAEALIAYILGLYPSSHLTDKQKKALIESKTGYKEPDFEKLFKMGMKSLITR